MRDIRVEPAPLERLLTLLDPPQRDRLVAAADRARRLLGERVVWNVNATAAGGGVAEMLQTLLAYGRGAGVDTRWLVLEGDPAFFRVTKRLHNRLHGVPGDGGALGRRERRIYDRCLAGNLAALTSRVHAGDLVLLHDPQTAGLVAGVRALGAHVLWRCHVGRDTGDGEGDDLATSAWTFLRGDVEQAEVTVFSRRSYAPAWLPEERVSVIPPSLDPFSAKNRLLSEAEVDATLQYAGLVAGGEPGPPPAFVRRDGSAGSVRRHRGLVLAGGPLPADARIVLQVSRWDALKDMAGVLVSFAEHLGSLPADAHLALVGPETGGVSDDPEGAGVLHECLGLWRNRPRAVRSRVHLVALPMDDVDENAHLVNALQHRASVVTQKSLAEGFGLTVTEPLWKSRPVVATRVGGIVDQVVDGECGLLLDDPRDLDGFARLVGGLLADPVTAARLGAAGHERVRRQFLGDRHLEQYVELFGSLV